MEFKPKLVTCLSRFPYPLDKGDKLRAYHQIRVLSEKFDIYLVCTSDVQVTNKQIDELKSYCKEIHVFQLKKWKIYLRLLFTVFSNKPFQVSYFYQYSIQLKINKLLKEIQPHYIYSQLIRTSEYVKNYHECSKTLDYMDAFSKGIERRMLQKKGVLKWIFQQEHQRLVNYERQIFEYFEHHCIISEQDRSFIYHPKYNQIVIVKNGVDKYFHASNDESKTIDILFTGNMGYPPNVEAAQFIYNSILPKLTMNPTCLIAGINPPHSLQKLNSKSFNVSGWVPDMRTCYEKSKVFIAPMFIGTGLQNKLLEAMAMGIPCITTTLANKALQATPEQEILIANSPEEFTKQFERLISDEQLYKQLAKNAIFFVNNNYSWSQCNSALIQLIIS